MSSELGGFQSLQVRMEEFQRQLQLHLRGKEEALRELISSSKTQFDQFQEEHSELSRKLEALHKEETELQAQVESFKSKNDETATRYRSLQTRKLQLEATRSTLVEECRNLDAKLDAKRQELADFKKQLTRQRELDNPEVKLYEKLLGLEIDASQTGILQFYFSNMAVGRSTRCEFTLDVSDPVFRIVETLPQLDQQVTDQLAAQLDQTSDIPGFLVAIRDQFIALIDRGE